MAAVLKVKFDLVVPDSVEVAPDMETKYGNSLVANASIVNDRRKASLPDEGTYITKLAQPSADGFSPMVDSAFVSRRGRSATEITNAQRKNAAESFQKYNDNLDLAFATVDGVVAKRFVDAVNTRKGNWSIEAARRSLRLTGDKVRGRGVAPIAANLLTGYAIAQSWLRAGDTWGGGVPYNVAQDGLEGSLRMALNSLLVRAGLTIISSEFNATILLAQNTNIENFLNGVEDLAKANAFVQTEAAGDTYCKFKLDGNTFKLVTQVNLGI
jgi:hypothetical protein